MSFFSTVHPLAWAGPDDSDLQHGRLALPPPIVETQASVSDSPNRPAKQARRTPSEQMYRSNPVSNQPGAKVHKSSQSRNTNYGQ